jgi:hypothetical protein
MILVLTAPALAVRMFALVPPTLDPGPRIGG